MCGRFVSASPPEEIAEYFDAAIAGPELPENYNVAPTSDVYVVYEDGSERRVDTFHWGLVPGWAKDLSIGNRLTNARAETVAEKNSFRRSLEHRRCIVPVDGFYEWKRVPGRKVKQPYYFHRADGEPLAFAGLWAEWRGELAGERVVVRSTTIITTEANATMAPVHDRMPVILSPDSWGRWLDPEVVESATVTPLLVPAPVGILAVHAVSTEVNNARHNGAHLLDEVDPDAPPPGEAVQTTLL